MTLFVHITTRLLRFLGALAALAALVALLVGVPWGLVTFIGWPLPDHLPTGNEIEATLLNPLSVTMLLDVLACIAWPLWATFVIDVAHSVPDAARGIRPPTGGPVHAFAGLLVAAAVLGLFPPRAPDVAVGPAHTVQPAAAVSVEEPAPVPYSPPNKAQRTQEPATVTVRPPEAGVHDSLWRIAERELGDAHRWTEIWKLNRDCLQEDGDALTDPHFIRPGWVLNLPEPDKQHTPPFPPTQKPLPPPGPSTDAPSSPTPPNTVQERHNAPVEGIASSPSTAITLTSGGVVAVTLAAAVTGGMLVRRRRRMRTYQPGSGERTPPRAPAPAVHALRLAHDEAHLDTTDPDDDPVTLPFVETDSAEAASVESERDATVPVGIRDDRAHALDLAAIHGLGLTGAGAEATARALLVHLLATTNATVLLPYEDARTLLGNDPPNSPRLRLVADLDEALALLAEANTPETIDSLDTKLGIVLVATIDQPDERLQALLDTEGVFGTAGILLGHWPAGATVRVRTDGSVAAASPNLSELRGARLFHLDDSPTRDLLDLLADTASEPPTGTIVFAENADSDAADDIDGEQDLDVELPLDDRSQPQERNVDADNDSPVAGGVQDTPETASSSIIEQHHEPVPESDNYAGAELVTPNNAPESPDRPLNLAMFGPLTLTWRCPDNEAQDLTSILAPKHKALLVFLALHPNGTSRGAVREALWPESRGRRPYNAFYASLSQIRKTLVEATDDQAPDPIVQHEEHVCLNPDLITVDYWQLNQAEHDQRRANTDDERFVAQSRITTLYRGPIAEGMSALWLDAPREAAHRTVLDALAGMASTYRGRDPQRQLQLLEHARLLSPENEDISRDIMRVQAELGLPDAISRTVHLLTTTLGDIGERPDPRTLTLARALQERHHQTTS